MVLAVLFACVVAVAEEEDPELKDWRALLANAKIDLQQRNFLSAVLSFDKVVSALNEVPPLKRIEPAKVTISGLAFTIEQFVNHWSGDRERFTNENRNLHAHFRSLVGKYAAMRPPEEFRIKKGPGQDLARMDIYYLQLSFAKALLVLDEIDDAEKLLEPSEEAFAEKRPIGRNAFLEFSFVKDSRLLGLIREVDRNKMAELRAAQFRVHVLQLKQTIEERKPYLRSDQKGAAANVAEATKEYQQLVVAALKERRAIREGPKDESDNRWGVVSSPYPSTSSSSESRARMDRAVRESREAVARQRALEAGAVGAGASRGSSVLIPGF